MGCIYREGCGFRRTGHKADSGSIPSIRHVVMSDV